MNLVGIFLVKANYIKAAKEIWVPCEARLLTDDIDTFLCIKSSLLESKSNNEDDLLSESCLMKAAKSQVSTSICPRPFTALCNLSEYKSCSVVAVTIGGLACFALKLIPHGLFGNKRLYLAVDNENEITTWLSIVKMCLGRKRRNNMMQSRESLISNGSFLRKAVSQDTLRTESSIKTDFDIDPMDNEVYEPYSSNDVIPAVIEQTGDWMKLKVSTNNCYLRLTADRLELLDGCSQRVLHWFPYLLIRRFGCVGGVLRVDAGRRCSTGDGKFFFRCSSINGQPVDALASQIRQLALEAKQRLREHHGEPVPVRQSNKFGVIERQNTAKQSLPPPVPPKCSAGSVSSTGSISTKSESPFLPKNDVGLPERHSRGDNGHLNKENTKEKIDETDIDLVPSMMQSNNIQKQVRHFSRNSLVEEFDGVFLASPGKSASSEETFRSQNEPISANFYDNSSAPQQAGMKYFRRSSQPSPRLTEIPHSSRENVELPKPKFSANVKRSSVERNSFEHPTVGLKSSRASPSVDSSIKQSASVSSSGFSYFRSPSFDRTLLGLAGRNEGAVSYINHLDISKTSQDPLRSPLQLRTCNAPNQPTKSCSKTEQTTAHFFQNAQPLRSDDKITNVLATTVEIGNSSTSPECRNATTSDQSGLYEVENGRNYQITEFQNMSLRNLDDVLQELRDANKNVTAAVQSAARSRRHQGLASPLDTSPIHSTAATDVPRMWTPMKHET